ncbi:hypothetical protein SH139x_001911 [Planctomycetaceae bacterium SH139]
MGRIEDLADNYERNISAPWQRNLAGAQKAIFVVYPKEDERKLRARIGEFAVRTRNAQHGWKELDVTPIFSKWMSKEEYREIYFEAPEDLKLKLDTEFLDSVVEAIRVTLTADDADENTVVAIYGAASLYGFLHVHEVLGKVANDIKGRLVLFFSGTYADGVYSLLDAKSGWNYLATPITHRTGE